MRPATFVLQDPASDSIHVGIGRERVRLAPWMKLESMLEAVYDAAVRDVRASLGPLERRKRLYERVGNRVRLVR